MEIRPMTMDDGHFIPSALELLNRTQGRDLFEATYLISRLQSDKALVLGAWNQQELLAIGVARELSAQDFGYYLAFSPRVLDWFQRWKIGSFDTLCVHEKYRGRGLGQNISQQRLVWLRERQCDLLLGVSWVSGLPHTSDRVFEKTGFFPVSRVENFYHQSSVNKPFFCPGCGEPPCTCAAILYRMNLKAFAENE